MTISDAATIYTETTSKGEPTRPEKHRLIVDACARVARGYAEWAKRMKDAIEVYKASIRKRRS